jgi:hypothetical protein
MAATRVRAADIRALAMAVDTVVVAIALLRTMAVRVAGTEVAVMRPAAEAGIRRVAEASIPAAVAAVDTLVVVAVTAAADTTKTGDAAGNVSTTAS